MEINDAPRGTSGLAEFMPPAAVEILCPLRGRIEIGEYGLPMAKPVLPQKMTRIYANRTIFPWKTLEKTIERAGLL